MYSISHIFQVQDEFQFLTNVPPSAFVEKWNKVEDNILREAKAKLMTEDGKNLILKAEELKAKHGTGIIIDSSVDCGFNNFIWPPFLDPAYTEYCFRLLPHLLLYQAPKQRKKGPTVGCFDQIYHDFSVSYAVFCNCINASVKR